MEFDLSKYSTNFAYNKNEIQILEVINLGLTYILKIDKIIPKILNAKRDLINHQVFNGI